MFHFHRGYIKHLFVKGKTFASLFPALPNEYSPLGRVFLYSGNQLDTHVDTHIQYIQTQMRQHTHVEFWAPCMYKSLTYRTCFETRGSGQLLSTFDSSLNVKKEFCLVFFRRKSYFLSVFKDAVCVHSCRCALGFFSVAVWCSERKRRAQLTSKWQILSFLSKWSWRR